MDYTVLYDDIFFPKQYIVSETSQGRLRCSQIVKMVADLNQVNVYLENQEYKEAIILIDKNIALLGDQYLSSKILLEDDTGMKLILGKLEQKKGHWKQAAYLKRNVLESRISIFQKIHKCPVVE